ncbi:substrate-binding periplasmic protein [Pseudomonas borbori]
MNFRQSLCVALLLLASTGSLAETIKVVTEDTSYSYLENGKVAGPASAVVEATLQRAGLSDYRMILYPWARAYDMALQEPNVLIYLIARTPARERLFKWVGEIERIEYHLYKLREHEDIQVQGLADARRYSVGVVRDDVRHHYLEKQGFNKVVVAAQNRDIFRMLLNQQVQLIPMPERDAQTLSEDAKIDFASLEKVHTLDALTTGLYMAYSPTTEEELVTQTRTAFDSIKAEGMVKRLMQPKK